MGWIRSIFRYDRGRIATHLLAALALAAAILAAAWWKPQYGLRRQLVLGSGYASFLFLVFSLLYGPWRLLKERRLPISIDLRRDIGIWAGIAGLVHAWWGLTIHVRRPHLLLNFVKPAGDIWVPRFSLWGWSNHLGLLAVIILILLLALSNDLSMRILRGRRWKFLQRFNYGLFLLVVAHTLGYQVVVDREHITHVIVLAALIAVLSAQAFGYRRTRKYMHGTV